VGRSLLPQLGEPACLAVRVVPLQRGERPERKLPSPSGRSRDGCRSHGGASPCLCEWSTGRRGATQKQYTYVNGVSRMREDSMRALWIVAAMIGLAILIFAHATVVGIVVGIAFLGLAVFLYRRPLVHRIGLGHR
jgi:hypothetical protein